MDASWSKDWYCRVPDWRWRRACELATMGEDWPRCADNDCQVLHAARFRCSVMHADDGPILRQLRRRKPAQYAAWCAYTDPGSARARWELEARLLTGDSDEVIARRIPLKPDAIACYESWFYNVRDRLDQWDWVFQQLLFPLLPASKGDQEFEYLWKHYGFTGGSAVLDSLIYGFCEERHPTDVAGVQAFWAEQYRDTIARKAALASHLTPVNGDTQIKLLNQSLKLLESDRTGDEGSTSDAYEKVLRGVHEAISHFPWRFGPQEGNHKFILDVEGACLRADEAMLVAEYGLPEEFRKLLASAKFPEKTPHGPGTGGTRS